MRLANSEVTPSKPKKLDSFYIRPLASRPPLRRAIAVPYSESNVYLAKPTKHLSANLYDMLTFKNTECDEQVDIIIGKGGKCVYLASGVGELVC